MNYALVLSDPAEADRDRLFLYYSRDDPAFGKRWYDELQISFDNMGEFPGPLSHGRDEPASEHYGCEVRRMFYYGPTKRRTGRPVRILFTLLPPDPADPPETAETVIFLLRLLHGAQPLTPDDPAE